MFKKRFLAVTLVAICCMSFSSCQTKAINGTYLARDVDECYAELGIIPGEDALLLAGVGQDIVLLTKPVSYLNNKFFVTIQYPIMNKEHIFNKKLDKITYSKDFYKATNEVVAKKAAKLFDTVQNEYGTDGLTIWVRRDKIDKNAPTISSSREIDATSLTEEKLLEDLVIPAENPTEANAYVCEWKSTERLEKLDPDFVNYMKETFKDRPIYNKPAYAIRATLEYMQNRYVFTVAHTFGSVMDDSEQN